MPVVSDDSDYIDYGPGKPLKGHSRLVLSNKPGSQQGCSCPRQRDIFFVLTGSSCDDSSQVAADVVTLALMVWASTLGDSDSSPDEGVNSSIYICCMIVQVRQVLKPAAEVERRSPGQLSCSLLKGGHPGCLMISSCPTSFLLEPCHPYFTWAY